MDFKNAKLLGKIGSILTIFVIIPFVGWLLGIVGLVLVLLSIKTISDNLKYNKIFTNYLISFIMNIISSVILIGGGFVFMLGMIRNLWNGARLWPGMMGNYFSNSGRVFGPGMTNPGLLKNLNIGSKAIGIILLIVVAWIVLVIGSYFLKQSYDEISEKTGEKNFKTSGLLFFLGAILLVAFGTGAIIMFIAAIFNIMAFFSLPDALAEPEQK
jgi:uncharacterized membrane protein